MRVLLNETITGDPVKELQFSSASWSTGICTTDTTDITLPGYIGQDLYQYLVPGKYVATIQEDDRRVRAAGILSIPETRTEKNGIHNVSYPGMGPERVFEKRVILPYPYLPLVNAAGYPIPSKNTTLSGVDYGTMMKKLYQQSMTHPDGSLPTTWQPDRSSTTSESQTWQAVDGRGVQEAVSGLSQLVNGPEWDWVPSIDENDRLSWSFVTGTESEPELTQGFWHTWQSGGEDPSIDDLQVSISPEFMAHTAIFTGGKDQDRVMIESVTNPDMVGLGIPLIQVWDSSNSSVADPATLRGWAEARLADGSAPAQYWSFKVRDKHAFSLRKGDWCTIDVYKHWILPDGQYGRRIVNVSGGSDSEWLNVTVAGVMEW